MQRSKRQKTDKSGRLSALEKLKKAKEKGVTNKYEVDDLKNVYDEVDEAEYGKTVLDRQFDSWIVDDGKYNFFFSCFDNQVIIIFVLYKFKYCFQVNMKSIVLFHN